MAHPSDCLCFACKVASLSVPRKLHRPSAPPRVPGNSYEAGIPTDHRGMPWLDTNTMQPLTQKTVNERRHLIHENERRHMALPAS